MNRKAKRINGKYCLRAGPNLIGNYRAVFYAAEINKLSINTDYHINPVRTIQMPP